MVLLIIVSVAWFAYTASKQNAQDAEFFSLEPESKARSSGGNVEEGLEDNIGLAYAKAGDDEEELEDEEDDDDERLG